MTPREIVGIMFLAVGLFWLALLLFTKHKK